MQVVRDFEKKVSKKRTEIPKNTNAVQTRISEVPKIVEAARACDLVILPGVILQNATMVKATSYSKDFPMRLFWGATEGCGSASVLLMWKHIMVDVWFVYIAMSCDELWAIPNRKTNTEAWPSNHAIILVPIPKDKTAYLRDLLYASGNNCCSTFAKSSWTRAKQKAWNRTCRYRWCYWTVLVLLLLLLPKLPMGGRKAGYTESDEQMGYMKCVSGQPTTTMQGVSSKASQAVPKLHKQKCQRKEIHHSNGKADNWRRAKWQHPDVPQYAEVRRQERGWSSTVGHNAAKTNERQAGAAS